ncbi:hypothetical protein [Micromonospora sp. DT47]|uniref:hypothetical protein n=1 Tax=Micromonospora sp. DT47 TaxID=3393431 RepID=UPI003CEDD1A2
MVESSSAFRQATVDITLSHPAATFLYRATKPRMRLDGVEIPARGWGIHRLPVTPGRHRLEVWVPYVLPRKAGRASHEFLVGEGKKLELEYLAPTVTFARGSLGAPGEQKSVGHSTVMVLNIVAAVVVLVMCAVLAFTS